MPGHDPTFTDLPLRALADAALSRASELRATHADVRVERVREGVRVFRDTDLETNTDSADLGLSVRVIHGGAWGFAAGITLTVDAAATLAEQAVATAKVSAVLTGAPVEQAPEPVHTGEWTSDYAVNPFDVDEAEKQGRLRELSERMLASDGVTHTSAMAYFVQENKYYADSAGTETRQQRVRIHPEFSCISVTDSGFSSMRTLAPPVGRGWEYLTGTDWDFDGEVATMPDLLAEHAKAPSVEAGRYDLVIDPTNLFLTIHESIGHATELDRALGYEAAYAGTSFATFDQLGSLRYGSEVMNVTGDRTAEHGLASTGWDDEGVASQQFDLIKDGVLVGYQLNRQMAAACGFDRSNGCAYADSSGHIPMQRMPNVSLQPAPDGPSTEELISGVDRGIYVVGDKSWSIDMQSTLR